MPVPELLTPDADADPVVTPDDNDWEPDAKDDDIPVADNELDAACEDAEP